MNNWGFSVRFLIFLKTEKEFIGAVFATDRERLCSN